MKNKICPIFLQTLKNKFLGSLLGLAVGDALGAFFEGFELPGQEEIELKVNPKGSINYTDDTHMAIGIIESIIECFGFDGKHMAGCFAKNFHKEPWRGYASGPPKVFRLIEEGESWDKAAYQIFRGGGSYGNGAAMRVGPIGLLYWKNHAQLIKIASQSSLITHAHPLGIEGAVLQAMAVALALAYPGKPFDKSAFLSSILVTAKEKIYLEKLSLIPGLLEDYGDRRKIVRQLGNGLEAFNAVPAAIFSFLAYPDNFDQAICYAISLGGDTDTIAAMTGAISGAYLGIEAIPNNWLEHLENRAYLTTLAEKLYLMWDKCFFNSLNKISSD